MRYLFSGTAVLLLLVGALFLAVGFLGGSLIGDWRTWPMYLGGILGSIGVYCVVRRRYTFVHFNLVFGFMPSVNEYEEYCRSAVMNEIKSRAAFTREAYRVEDEARDAMRKATGTGTEKAITEYKNASDRAESCRKMFYGAIDAATSRWLPTPYAKISRNLEDWEPAKKSRAHSF